jgi:hypothetical protein
LRAHDIDAAGGAEVVLPLREVESLEGVACSDAVQLGDALGRDDRDEVVGDAARPAR